MHGHQGGAVPGQVRCVQGLCAIAILRLAAVFRPARKARSVLSRPGDERSKALKSCVSIEHRCEDGNSSPFAHGGNRKTRVSGAGAGMTCRWWQTSTSSQRWP